MARMRAVFLFVIITIFIGDIIGEKYKNIKKYKIVRSYICNQYNSDNKFYTENGKKKILNKYRIKYNTKIKRLNVLLNIKEINLIKNVNFLSSINMVTSLSSIFIFMHILNYFKLINNTHRNALLEITDKICSKIFLFNTINDIINTNFQKNIPKYFIIGLFSITQFIFHTLFSNVMACLFYSRDQQNGEKIIEKKNITKCEDNNKENNYLLEKSLSKSNEVSNYIKTKNEDILNKNYHNGSLRNDINNSKQIETSEIERKNNMNNVSLLKHLCTLSHTGLIPMYVFNYMLKKLNYKNDNINIMINFYNLFNSILSKIYVNYFIKNSNIENSGDSSSPDKKINKWCTPLALLNSIFNNSFSYFLLISIFLKFIDKTNTIYENSLKKVLLMFNNILPPSILIIISNILYDGLKENSKIPLKDLFFILNNKYVLIPSFFFVLSHLNDYFKVFEISKNLHLFLLIQAMTPPNYNIYFLSEKISKLQNIKKTLCMSYPIYLIPLFIYSFILFEYFNNKL
ncbi:hypothetical protein YYC_02683 [Plasmodium yoelii 17X]|uniref:Apicoplast integral membrane protein, putative n=3 Tax=Plasmodium yoelii TaxID=5861 RepID=A0A078K971_PLAYE|nr:apicoplast integral membrane protein, putative [Plasmodium yoelii]ETB60393.1 hypothetical protein YYC_02683 [Plasmodium yoelii 17X]CDU17487.1 conserved Plasmodium protein, unknown function [Plasmodium yoelii]VTZ77250.1 apicoplast integral membrane protein, putative [Plasmodium yoelii]|eukprot:XP_022811925.1 apicoplast integral membrane protein, putative [Plasmodium yoelii]